ncbi:MAG: pantoate--beta-alanine ligase [Pyrinomonadaceae bacterium]
MEIIGRRLRMSSVARKLRREESKTIGLVPTMGALHEGHLSLIREARRMSDVVIVSIFVNPAQFAPGEDFGRYPRDLTKDTAVLTDYNVDYIYAPSVEEIYPKGFSSYVNVEGLSEKFEGVSRPGHFRGVATIVNILLNTIHPDFAFFGQKDAQQAVIVKRLVRDLSFNTEIVVLPIVREESGLALSSRNAYLNEEEREAADVIRRALKRAKAASTAGEHVAKHLIEIVEAGIDAEPLARLDYAAIVDPETFESIDRIDDRPVLLVIAVFISKIRLIDNIIMQAARMRKGTGELKEMV